MFKTFFVKERGELGQLASLHIRPHGELFLEKCRSDHKHVAQCLEVGFKSQTRRMELNRSNEHIRLADLDV